MVKEAKVRVGKGQGKKGKSSKGKIDDVKRKGTGGKWQARKAFERHCNHGWKWGHMEKDCPMLAKTKAKDGQGKSAGSLDQLADLVCGRLETSKYLEVAKLS